MKWWRTGSVGYNMPSVGIYFAKTGRSEDVDPLLQSLSSRNMLTNQMKNYPVTLRHERRRRRLEPIRRALPGSLVCSSPRLRSGGGTDEFGLYWEHKICTSAIYASPSLIG